MKTIFLLIFVTHFHCLFSQEGNTACLYSFGKEDLMLSSKLYDDSSSLELIECYMVDEKTTDIVSYTIIYNAKYDSILAIIINNNFHYTGYTYFEGNSLLIKRDKKHYYKINLAEIKGVMRVENFEVVAIRKKLNYRHIDLLTSTSKKEKYNISNTFYIENNCIYRRW